jgi:serine/threonine protein kinase
MSKIYHPNTVLFLGACTSVPGKYMIVTELLTRTVEAIVFERPCSLSLLARLRLAKDAALGMLWLHSSKPVIIHRDLKLSNLLVDEHLCVKIGDFGLSQLKPFGEQYFLQDTPSAGVQGTPLWMAPEVMRNEPFNEKADVYSFGIILWQLLTTTEPFTEFEFLDDFVRAVAVQHVRCDVRVCVRMIDDVFVT